jgi:dTDP-4-amino-4,6-dideoxygalactose transaminase
VPAPQRDDIVTRLQGLGIDARVCYPSTIPRQAAYAELGHWPDFRVADAAAREVSSIPVHPALSGEDRAFVGDKVREVRGL